MKRIAGIVACAVALAACFVAAGCAGETGSLDNAITVSASATVQVVPDKATLGIKTSAEGKTADEARAAGEAAVRGIADALKGAGLTEDNVEAGAVELKEHVTPGTGEVVDGYEDEEGNWIDVVDEDVVTYTAAARINVSGFDSGKLAEVVRAAAQAGAKGFVDLEFTVSDRNAAYQQALNQAVEAAHAKAEALAKAGGVYVGRVVNLVEGDHSAFETTVKDDAGKLDPKVDSTLNVAPSKVAVDASVTVSYAIS